MKKKYTCGLLFAMSCSAIAAPKTEKQIAEIVNRTRGINFGEGVYEISVRI